MKPLILFLTLVICVAPVESARAQAACAQGVAAEDAFRRGGDLSEAGRHADAIPCFLVAYRARPDNPAVLWNLGIASAEVGAPNEALKYWLAYKAVEPNDWRACAKLVQTYQTLGDRVARDRERDALLGIWRRAAAGSEVRRTEHYCREQMVLAGRKVLAFEVFEPRADKAIFYFFVMLDAAGREESRISLGSYASTNRVAQEIGGLPKGKRLYHLDRYDRSGHATFAFLESRPSYEEVRVSVQGILNGTMKPLSSTTRSR